MHLKLKERFPELEVLDNSEFSKDSQPQTAFWLRGAEKTKYTEKDSNTLYCSNDYFNKNYEFEVYKKFDNWCRKFGWYASSENYTLQLFRL